MPRFAALVEIASGFNATSTTTDAIKGINLTGKVAIVTGEQMEAQIELFYNS